MPEISVIVPVFRVEKYIEKCIQSLQKQTFSDFEIILIDDGSDDQSGSLCDLAAQNDSRILVIHQKNAGVSAARNSGIQIAKGNYIVFVDSDDYVSDTYLENLMSAAVTSDYVATGCYVQKPDMRWEKWSNHENKLTLNQIIQEPEKIKDVPMGMIYARRYKRSIIQDNAIRFDETIKRGEDVLFNIHYLKVCKEIEIVDVNDYSVCHRNDSATACINFNYFRWSMKSAVAFGTIIGEDNDIFRGHIWNNAMTVCDHYFRAATETSFRTKLKMISALYEVCANRYVRKSLPYARKQDSRKKAFMVQFYLYPFLPFIYPTYASVRNLFKKG